MPVRMKDIARDLGVSVVTVSKVLRNHSDISEATKQRVLRRMKELNYRPNLAARSLVTGRSGIVGLVVPDLVHPFFGEIAMGMSRVLRRSGLSLLIASSEEDPKLEKQEIEQLLARQVDALVVASTQKSAKAFELIEEHRTPYVLIDRKVQGLDANFVGVDDREVGTLATEHLIARGCRRIAHIRGPAVSTATGRYEGYCEALARHGVAANPDWVVTESLGDLEGDVSGREAMLQLIARKPRPDGVFCYNDPTALGAIRAILESGLRVPEDIAVVASGNTRNVDLLRVPLSSVDQDSAMIGERAAKLALSLIGAKKQVKPVTVLLQPRLIVRASSQNNRQAHP
jgi:LacI family transcriptional regulator